MTTQNTKAQMLIEQLGLAPHPEGGWYKELWRGDDGADGRSIATSIHFLLEAGQKSHWHKVDATEIWLWHAGDPLTLLLAADDAGPITSLTLSADIAAGHFLQHAIPPGEWQAATPVDGAQHGYSLVSCIVAPGFDFSGFTLAAPDWYPGA